jgi:hypothetical protein
LSSDLVEFGSCRRRVTLRIDVREDKHDAEVQQHGEFYSLTAVLTAENALRGRLIGPIRSPWSFQGGAGRC